MKNSKLGLFLAVFLSFTGIYSTTAQAAPLEEITLQPQEETVVATIRLSGPVRYQRHFPAKHSKYLEIYYDRVNSNSAAEPWVDFETRQSPRTSSIPTFTVTTRDQSSSPKLVIEFAAEADYSVMPGPDGASFVITILRDKSAVAAVSATKVSLPFLPTIATPIVVAGTTGEVDYNQQGNQLMVTGREALSKKDYDAATQAFNKLLLLPPNQYTQDAQEWVGVSRERGGQLAKAKIEYELYLKLYSASSGAARVQQRLAGLANPVEVKAATSEKKKQQDRQLTQGSITSRYYYGTSTIKNTPTDLTSTAWDPSTTTLVDTNFLNTYVDASERLITEEYDARIVFRDVAMQNFAGKQSNRNRMNAAYFDIKNRLSDYSARLGRQSSSGGGVMGRYDGITASYGAPQDFKTTVVAGQLVDFVSTYNQPIFYGATVEKGPVSVYVINQLNEGMVDRRAVGGDIKYFESKMTAYALVDYDIYFQQLTNALATGTLSLDSGTTFNAMVNYNKLVSERNALMGATSTSVGDLLASGVTEEQLKQLAIDRTMSSAFGQLGVTQNVTKNWQVGVDLRVAQLSGLPQTGVAIDCTTTPGLCISVPQGYIAAIPNSGTEYTGTLQLVGRNLLLEADVTSFGASYMKSDVINSSTSLFVYNHSAYDRDLSFDTSLRYYQQDYTAGGTVNGAMPMLRVMYQAMNKLSFDLDVGYEISNNSGIYQTVVTNRQFGSFGFRWDL